WKVAQGWKIISFGLLHFYLCKKAGFVTPGSHEDRNPPLAGDQEWFVAEVFGCSVGVDSDGELALAAIASGEHIDAQAAPGERLGQRDGQRRLARAAGGEVADGLLR